MSEEDKTIKKQPIFTRGVNILLVLIVAVNYIIYGDWPNLFGPYASLVIGTSAIHVSVVYAQVWITAFILTRVYSFVKNKFTNTEEK